MASTIGFTWPLAPSLATHTISHMDAQFSSWRLAWLARQLLHPGGGPFFDGNIFWPANRTLAYSDAVLVQGALGVPLFGLGLPPVAVMNLLTMLGLAASGAAAYVLARRLTRHTGAALLAGVVFAFSPFRLDHVQHLEMQWAMWMPLAFWAWHRAMEEGRFRDGFLVGLFVLLQLLSSIYYGIFLGTVLALAGVLAVLVRWLRAPQGGRARWRHALPGRRALAGLVAGALVLGLAASRYARPYDRVHALFGDRDAEEIERYSATLDDFVATRDDNIVYGGLLGARSEEERRLFPGVTPLLLAGAAVVPPASAAAVVYGAALAFSADAALGLNGRVYPRLRSALPPYRGLRVPARFGVLVQLCLGILAAFGLAALARRWPRAGTVLTTAALALVLVEYAPRPQRLMRVFSERPRLYAWLARQPPGTVTLELPLPTPLAMPRLDPLYMANATWHWQPLVNGYSGHYYPPYLQLLDTMRSFPSDEADEALARLKVQILIVHRAFYREGEYEALIARIESRPRFRLMQITEDQFDLARAYAVLADPQP